MDIFLGMPSAKIKAWIKEHRQSPKNQPLCFTAEQDWSSVSLVQQGNGGTDPTPPNLLYSLNDTKHWTEYEINKIIPLEKDAKVFFKANGQNERISPPYTTGGKSMFYTFVMKGKIAASGNIQYLLDETGSRADVPSYCYNSMFGNNLALTQAPSLPATTLADSCYTSMFFNCSSLTKAPALPATTLADKCYNIMFGNCTALTQAPALPATTLARYCYNSMFGRCSKFSECHMKVEMKGVYNTSTHGNTTKTVVYDL